VTGTVLERVDAGAGGGLAPMFAPRGIAVVGASRTPGKLGATMARSLAGFAAGGGHLALVNARDDTMHDSVRAAALAGPLDLAVLCIPAFACPGVVAEAAAAGAGAAVICGGGFAEVGGDGARLQRELATIASDTGIRLLGPNTSGFLAPHAGVTASFVPGVARVRPGRVAVVAASGGVNHALMFLLTDAGHGVSLAVGLGNAVDVTAPDLLDHLADDPDTGAVALHVESVADGPRLVAAVRRLTERRPVVALVVGRHDVAAFAESHTGALATSWRTTRAALAQAGAVLVDDERELVDAVGALSVARVRPSARPGVGVVTAQAGPGLLLLDDLRRRRADVPELTERTRATLAELLPPLTYQRNPVDTGRPGPEFGRVLAAVAADPGVDVIAGYALHEPDAVDVVAVAREGATAGVPIVLGIGGAGEEVARTREALLAAGVAVATDPHGVAAATAALLAHARSVHARSVLARSGRATPCRAGRPPTIEYRDYDEHDAKELLGRLGVSTPGRRACPDRASAHAALAELGSSGPGSSGPGSSGPGGSGPGGSGPGSSGPGSSGPGGQVAVKILDARILHKTDIGGVHLGIRTAADLDAALDMLDAALDRLESAPARPDGAPARPDRAGTRRYPAAARRYLVEAMAPAGVDLVVGARRDPVFGPVVLLGLGGTTAEALADVSVRLAPLIPAEAAAMPAELAGHLLLTGWRGGPAVDDGELGGLLAALGDLIAANPELDEIEINPLRLTSDGLVALDAVIITREADSEVANAQPDQ
jgi:acetyltransferase